MLWVLPGSVFMAQLSPVVLFPSLIYIIARASEASARHAPSLILTVVDSSVTPLLRWLLTTFQRIVQNLCCGLLVISCSLLHLYGNLTVYFSAPTTSLTFIRYSYYLLEVESRPCSLVYVLSVLTGASGERTVPVTVLIVNLCLCVCVIHWTLCSFERSWAWNQLSLTSEAKFPNFCSGIYNRKIIVSTRKLKPGKVRWLPQQLTELKWSLRLF